MMKTSQKLLTVSVLVIALSLTITANGRAINQDKIKQASSNLQINADHPKEDSFITIPLEQGDTSSQSSLKQSIYTNGSNKYSSNNSNTGSSQDRERVSFADPTYSGRWSYMVKESQQSCELFSSFGVSLQLLLAILVVTVLLFKRSLEKPQRPIVVWSLDFSKLMLNSTLLHFSNLWFSILMSKRDSSNYDFQCHWYLYIFIFQMFYMPVALWCFSNLIQYMMNKFVLDSNQQYELGYYGRDCYRNGNRWQAIYSPETIKNLLIQSMHWIVVSLMAVTLCFTVIFMLETQALNSVIIALYPIHDQPETILVLVLVVIPTVGDLIQFWIIDSIIMKQFTQSEFNQLSGVEQRKANANDKSRYLNQHQMDLLRYNKPVVIFRSKKDKEDIRSANGETCYDKTSTAFCTTRKFNSDMSDRPVNIVQYTDDQMLDNFSF